ncbi:hypothetical protein SAMN04488102_10716 [Alkalibacterium subtropicum]|uniref:Uncharacterized protein n=2 Tax=Alkalibacterium subtropicum TaxID=753702 RepID=A0A1I1J8N7_9LACT|nr:hypothetical protein SAMN04488102_10716 [Alkalibacterium subtropicum]
MKRYFHNSMIIIGLTGLFLSLSGLLAKTPEASEVSDAGDLSLEEIDEIVTVAQHEYQLKEQKYKIPDPPDHSTYKGITLESSDAGHILWEDPDGVEHKTAFTVENGIVLFTDEDVIRDVDRSRFISIVIAEIKEGEVE